MWVSGKLAVSHQHMQVEHQKHVHHTAVEGSVEDSMIGSACHTCIISTRQVVRSLGSIRGLARALAEGVMLWRTVGFAFLAHVGHQHSTCTCKAALGLLSAVLLSTKSRGSCTLLRMLPGIYSISVTSTWTSTWTSTLYVNQHVHQHVDLTQLGMLMRFAACCTAPYFK